MPSDAAAPRVPAVVERLRLASVVLALWVLTFAQSSGRPSADTKLDLVVAPARFLRNAVHMWDPVAASGQMQDQAYGYLFPMGPVFLLGKLAALPAWVVQRSWESLLLTVAFLGAMRVARLLGVRGFVPAVGSGLAYALAPRMLSELTVISAELIPVALLPWVLAPLITGATSGAPRRAAARSGIAYAFVGGINASAALAILPVPVLWLLTRSRGPRRRALLLWWFGAIAAASLWWVVPLLVLGKYSPPFLDWIESSSVTTSVTDLIDVVRGTDHWQAFLGPQEWPGAWTLVSATGAIIGTVAVATLGVTGIAKRGTPHRGFLVSSLLVGLLAVTVGHDASVGPIFAHGFRTLLDGPLNAFRNVHKFDPLLRLPLAIGVGHALALIGERVPREITLRRRSLIVFPRAIVAVALAGFAALAISPMLTGDLVTQTRSVNDPTWWTETGRWLGAHEAQGRALIVPGAAQPGYVWGNPRDDALQPVADGAWAVRDAAPLGQAGYVRLLDAVEAILASGQPDPALAPMLARAGIQYLVIRNDLAAGSPATALPFVQATVQSSPGWSQVAAFGDVFGGRDDPARLFDGGLTASPDAVQVFANADYASGVALLPATGAVAANGSADELPDLIAAGLRAGTPVLFGNAADAVRAAGVPVTATVDDAIRRREFGFGAVDRYSATMTADEAYRQQRRVHDYLPRGTTSGDMSVAQLHGIADVSASTSGADIARLHTSAADGPWSAVDGDPRTAWRSAALSGAVGQWLTVALTAPTTLPSLQVDFGTGSGALPSRVRVSTDAGSLDEDVAPADLLQTLRVPEGPTQRVRITVLRVADGTHGGRVVIRTLTLGGVAQPTRTLVVPSTGDPDVVAFATAPGARPPCLTNALDAAVCDPAWQAVGEEEAALDRTVALSGSYLSAVRFRFVPGARLDQLLDFGNPLQATASSRDSADPRERPGAAVDGNLRTGWVAKAGDGTPTLTVTLSRRARLTGLTLLPITGAPVTRPTEVRVRAGGETFTADVPDDGVIAFPSTVTARQVVVTVVASTLRTSTNSATGIARQLPVGIGELRLTGPGVPAAKPASAVLVGCRETTALSVDGTPVPLHVLAPAADALAGRIVSAQPCSSAPLSLASGSHDLRVPSSALLQPLGLTLARRGAFLASPVQSAGAVAVRHWGRTSRTVQVDASTPAFLVVHENANAGWRATLHGKVLTPVTIDGWQQGWLLPAGANGVVHLGFTPQRPVDIGFVVGAVALLGLLVAAAWRARREPPAPLRDGVLAWPVTAGMAAVALVLLGGVVGAVLAAAVGVLAAGLRRRRSVLPVWIAVVPIAVAGIAQAAARSTSVHTVGNSAAEQLLCLLAVALLLAAATPWPAESTQQRALEQVPGHGGDRGGAERGEHEQLEEVPAEQLPPQRSLDDDQQP